MFSPRLNRVVDLSNNDVVAVGGGGVRASPKFLGPCIVRRDELFGSLIAARGVVNFSISNGVANS